MALFGSSTPQAPNLFGAPNNQPPQATGSSLFGASTQRPAASTSTGLFGAPAQAQSTAQQGSSLFGGTTQPQQHAASLFGGTTQPQQQAASLFGSTTQPQQQTQASPGSSLFQNPGASQQKPNPFGASTLPQQGTGLFGASVSQPQPATGVSSSGVQSFQSSRMGAAPLWQPGSGISPRQKSVPEQIQTVTEKWRPQGADCVFEHYFYNHVGEHRAPYYRPPPEEDEKKWEAALAKKPGPGYIPVRAVGYADLAARLSQQAQYLKGYNARMHEINDSLTAMLQRHDLVVSIRAADARRRHQTLSQRCTVLATKVQVLKNRGYAMSGEEEELKKKLRGLEKMVLDPALEGRSEGIWARMFAVRERAEALQREMDKSAHGMTKAPTETIDDELVQKASKILDDFASQLHHLRKELEQIHVDLASWEQTSRTSMGGTLRGR
ncbi:MAG: hypothetical protein M1838_000033 [Thelocarpon superellum]|nr:MAG: hypothetical protein M1838_000033 [Thelocarpon superellum]